MKLLGIAFAAVSALVCSAADQNCRPIGGVLMTNIGAIDGKYNLGPVFGDLSGAVAAQVVEQSSAGILIQHHWVASTGETIDFKPALLKPASTGDPNIAVVPWGNYKAEIKGGTGSYENATGFIDCFGLADFKERTLVLRFRGELCTEKKTK